MGLSHPSLEAKMDYWQLRKMFVEKSGRYDLVNADWTDNGADFFINAGQRLLDRLASSRKGMAKNVQEIAAGTIKVYQTGLRAVQEVWAGTSTDGLVQLERVTLEAIRQYYEKQLSSVDQGCPLYYAPVAFRPFPDITLAATWASYYDADDMILGDTHYTYNGVIISPPPDQTYYISIIGKFYSPDLSATLSGSTWTQTKSHWSQVHPEVLLKAALYELEVFYRNTEGAKDWKGAMDLDLLGLDQDLVEEDYSGINQMEG